MAAGYQTGVYDREARIARCLFVPGDVPASRRFRETALLVSFAEGLFRWPLILARDQSQVRRKMLFP